MPTVSGTPQCLPDDDDFNSFNGGSSARLMMTMILIDRCLLLSTNGEFLQQSVQLFK
jgi:hypothetical protein